jgi:DNA replication protein DnaC
VECPECEAECSELEKKDAVMEKEKRFLDVIRASHIPRIHLALIEKKFDFYCEEQMDAQSRIYKKIFHGKHSGIILHGFAGTGKSLLLAWGAYEYADRFGYDIEFTTALEIHQEWKGNFDAEISLRNRLSRVGLLIIDEADIFPRSRDAMGPERIWFLLNQIITKRTDENLPTWMGTNQTVDELQRIYSARSIGRIVADGEVIECNWPSYRSKQIKGGTL